jgi:hypothetical protein
MHIGRILVQVKERLVRAHIQSGRIPSLPMATKLKGEMVFGMETAETENLRGRSCFSVTSVADAKKVDLRDDERQELKTKREDNSEKVKKATERCRMCQLKASQAHLFGLSRCEKF